MSITNKPRQLEPIGRLTRSGTKNYPMRPMCGVLRISGAAEFTPPIDASGGATWTTSSSAATPQYLSGPFFDDREQIDLTGAVLTLNWGVWLVELDVMVENTNAVNPVSVAAAITNSGGTAVNVQSADIVIPILGFQRIRLVYLGHLSPVETNLTTQFRFLQRTDPNTNQDLRVQGATLATFTKLSNADDGDLLQG